jgi:hypothetical protein
MSLTAFITSFEYDIQTVLNALNGKFAHLIEEWSESKQVTFTRKGKEETKTKTTHFAVILIEPDAIEALRFYVKVVVHKNFYPRDWHDASTLYVRMTPEEKERVEEILSLYKKATGSDYSYEYIPKNGFGFYKFSDSYEVPMIAGLLRAYPELLDVEINYAKKQEERPKREAPPPKKRMIRKKDGTVIFNAPKVQK